MNGTLKGGLLAAAVMSLAAGPAWSQRDSSQKRDVTRAPARPTSRLATAGSQKLHEDMRKLWTDHVVWTRLFIIDAAADLPSTQTTTDRLMKNQEEIGDAVATYYGKPAGEKLTGLLKSHIAEAAEIVKAAKANDDAAVKAGNEKWEANADSIATFLSAANPNWPKASLTSMLKGHLSTTTEEVKARLSKNWDADVKAFDAVYDHILKMSDALADGIVKQFPQKFMMASKE